MTLNRRWSTGKTSYLCAPVKHPGKERIISRIGAEQRQRRSNRLAEITSQDFFVPGSIR